MLMYSPVFKFEICRDERNLEMVALDFLLLGRLESTSNGTWSVVFQDTH
jgi:hypothetical protein